ncbi:hypothetical protein NLG97_g3692 [Lecanicillium saksenae]|uniref:Uncharacterized protein n=1 Tax=Lecanicillium saksenae TaxID=468837 RepID=A0ACC1QXX8_9HYPO|nr:hypothetical protein NLG97_g3692 [Lecanicillium saksenae]
MRIALAQRNLQSAEDEILQVSDPSSPNFSRHWSPADIIHVATDAYSLPAGLDYHIDFITPTVHLGAHNATLQHASRPPSVRALAVTNGSGERFSLSTCAQYSTPDCLRALYGIPVSNKSHPDNSVGIFEPAWASWLPGDLDKFFQTFNNTLVGQRPVMAPIDGGYWQDTVPALFFNDEPDLDMQYVMALTYPLPVTNYQVGDVAIPGTLNNLLAAFDAFYCSALNASIDGIYPDLAHGGYNRTTDCGTISEPTKVLSISFAYDEINFPTSYLRRQCFEFLKLGLQGVSVIVSSADCGPAGQSCKCISHNSNSYSTQTGDFRPTSPASCPFVTVVGGTQLPPNGTVQDREIAFRHTSADGHVSTSGGGFSNIFEMPPWQISSVAGYVAKQGARLESLAGRYNRHGRAIPDVAANAANYVVAVDGHLMTAMGTSASAPVFASVIAKLNDARLFAAKKPLGFLNPALYANSYLLNDVVEGSNYGCGGEAFLADHGWDPVTGLGTPNFARLLDFYLSLP